MTSSSVDKLRSKLRPLAAAPPTLSLLPGGGHLVELRLDGGSCPPPFPASLSHPAPLSPSFAPPPSLPPSPRLLSPLQSRSVAMDEGDEAALVVSLASSSGSRSAGDKMFSLKKWNAVAMWSWDVECDTCAICRVQVMGESPVLASQVANVLA